MSLTCLNRASIVVATSVIPASTASSIIVLASEESTADFFAAALSLSLLILNSASVQGCLAAIFENSPRTTCSVAMISPLYLRTRSALNVFNASLLGFPLPVPIDEIPLILGAGLTTPSRDFNVLLAVRINLRSIFFDSSAPFRLSSENIPSGSPWSISKAP